jgi:hypothetical protein
MLTIKAIKWLLLTTTSAGTAIIVADGHHAAGTKQRPQDSYTVQMQIGLPLAIALGMATASGELAD